MLRAISTHVYVRELLTPAHLDTLARGGAEAIELFGHRGHLDYSSKPAVRELANWFRGNTVKLNSMHSPMFFGYEWEPHGAPINIAEPDRKLRTDAVDEIKRALEISEQVPFRFLVQHIGVSKETFAGRKFDAAMNAVDRLRSFAKPLAIRILLENIPNELSTADRLVEFLNTTQFEDVGVCFDIGHAHVMDTVADTFEKLKPHIRSTHIHDNNKDEDSHLWPGEGSIDWNEAMRLLRSAPHVPPLLLEIKGAEGMKVSERAAAAFDKLEKAPSRTD